MVKHCSKVKNDINPGKNERKKKPYITIYLDNIFNKFSKI